MKPKVKRKSLRKGDSLIKFQLDKLINNKRDEKVWYWYIAVSL